MEAPTPRTPTAHTAPVKAAPPHAIPVNGHLTRSRSPAIGHLTRSWFPTIGHRLNGISGHRAPAGRRTKRAAGIVAAASANNRQVRTVAPAIGQEIRTGT